MIPDIEEVEKWVMALESVLVKIHSRPKAFMSKLSNLDLVGDVLSARTERFGIS